MARPKNTAPKPEVIDIGLPLPKDLHAELTKYLEEYNQNNIGKITKREYAIHSLREQLKRDKEGLAFSD